MQNKYIKNMFRYLVGELQNEIDNKYTTHMNLRLGFMIGLLIILFFVYLSMWLPLIGRLSTDVSFKFYISLKLAKMASKSLNKVIFELFIAHNFLTQFLVCENQIYADYDSKICHQKYESDQKLCQEMHE